MKKCISLVLTLVAALCLLLSGCGGAETQNPARANAVSAAASLADIPAFSGQPYVVLHDNKPDFSESDFSATSFERYSPLDSLGRCGAAFANIGRDIMPTEKRGAIGQVKPSGWQVAKYDGVDGKYLYNRCHLIGYQLSAENANKQNLITGTRYMNVQGMLPFENMVADYVKETGNHVLYRVTPVFQGKELVARGVQIEAESVEDKGAGICFNVYCYNVQPGIVIDYATGRSHAEGGGGATDHDGTVPADAGQRDTYVLNTNSKKFHKPSCSGAKTIKSQNKETYTGSRGDLLSRGYSPCGSCKP